MLSSSGPVAYHLAYQLIDPGSVDTESVLFAHAVNSVVEGFVPVERYVGLAARQEPAWRKRPNERELEERARLLIDCSLNPLALAGKSLPDAQALKRVSDLFFLHEAVAVKTRLKVVGDAVEVIREREIEGPAAPLCRDAVACIIDVTRQYIGGPSGATTSPNQHVYAPRGFEALLALGRRLGQQGTAPFALIDALKESSALTVEKAAKALGCSSRTLQRQLQPLGLSLPRVRLAGNLLRGIGLLSQGGNLSEIAVEAGFFDYAHFARTFTRSSGFSPTTYQQVLGVVDVSRLQALV